MKVCDIPDCEKPIRAKGLCGMHYERLRTHGVYGGPQKVVHRRDSICVVEECFKPHCAKGFCQMHYLRMKNHGSIYGTSMTAADDDRTLEQRFMDNVWIVESGCWVWMGALYTQGYAAFYVMPGTRVRGHRWSYEHFVSPVPDGMVVDHRCRVRSCVNPSHLRPATFAQNARNRGGVSDTSSAFRNVHLDAKSGRWHVSVACDGEHHWGGAYDSESEAAAAAERLRCELFGEFAGVA